MPSRKRPYKLHEAIHLGMDFHVVDSQSLEVRPVVPALFAALGKAPGGNVERGSMAWAAGTADHQISLRNQRPAVRWEVLHKRLQNEVNSINEVLARMGCTLLPTGAHPWMDATSGSVLRDDELVQLCHRIFNCNTPGWCNSAGTRLEITFDGDQEFMRLHAAVRLLLPIIPALTAASPFLNGRWTGFLDARMEAYLHMHERHPELMGSLVPEAVFDQEDYYRMIYGPIAQVLAEHEGGNLLDHEQANARGAVAHFDRGTLEIRVMDTQEHLAADLAIAEFIITVLKALSGGRWVSTYLHRAWGESDLLAIFLQVIKDGGQTSIANHDYLLMFGLMKQDRMSAHKLWQHLFVELYGDLSDGARQTIGHILEHGCLAGRILRRTGRNPSREVLRDTYQELATCLREDKPFA